MFGILNIYKPKGMTSHDVVSILRRNLHMKRIGHAGTLDPIAEGVLPILVGKATKLSDLIMAEEKKYVARVRLGVITDTDDMSGTIIETKNVAVTEDELKKVVETFLGETEQIPPMYSAIKVDGKKLYQLARKGIVTERKPRKITLFSANISNFDGLTFDMAVHCSKGTYIRALCRDMGEKLGTGAAMESLIRTQSGLFTIDNSHTLEEIENAIKEKTIDTFFIDADATLLEMRSAVADEKIAEKIKNGIRLRPEQIGIENANENEMFRIYSDDSFLCILKAIKNEGQIVLAMEKSFY